MARPRNAQVSEDNGAVTNWFQEYFISHSSGQRVLTTMSSGFQLGFLSSIVRLQALFERVEQFT